MVQPHIIKNQGMQLIGLFLWMFDNALMKRISEKANEYNLYLM